METVEDAVAGAKDAAAEKPGKQLCKRPAGAVTRPQLCKRPARAVTVVQAPGIEAAVVQAPGVELLDELDELEKCWSPAGEMLDEMVAHTVMRPQLSKRPASATRTQKRPAAEGDVFAGVVAEEADAERLTERNANILQAQRNSIFLQEVLGGFASVADSDEDRDVPPHVVLDRDDLPRVSVADSNED